MAATDFTQSEGVEDFDMNAWRDLPDVFSSDNSTGVDEFVNLLDFNDPNIDWSKVDQALSPFSDDKFDTAETTPEVNFENQSNITAYAPNQQIDNGLDLPETTIDVNAEHQYSTTAYPPNQQLNNGNDDVFAFPITHVENANVSVAPLEASYPNQGFNGTEYPPPQQVHNQYDAPVSPQNEDFSFQYDPMAVPQYQHVDYQHGALEGPALPYPGGRTFNALETPQNLPRIIDPLGRPLISPVTTNPSPVLPEILPPTDNAVAPPAARLPTPPQELIQVDFAVPYRPNAPRKKAGRPPGSKTKKARFENGKQQFDFEHTTIHSHEFKAQVKRLKTKAHDAATGAFIPGRPVHWLELGQNQRPPQ